MGNIYFCYGIPKSASSFAWALIKRTAILGGLDVCTLTSKSKGVDSLEDGVDPVSEEKLAAVEEEAGPRSVVIKTHGAATTAAKLRIAEGRGKAFASYRDLRDVALSLADHGARARAKGVKGNKDFAEFFEAADAVDPLRDVVLRFESWVESCDPLLIPYDEISFHSHVTVERIAQKIGVNVDPEDVLRFFKEKKSSIIHYNKGIPRRFESEMAPELSERFLDVFRDFYRKYFPDELTSTRHARAAGIGTAEKQGMTRSTRMLTSEAVMWAYRYLLGREPESSDVIERHCRNFKGGWREFREATLRSPEFTKAQAGAKRPVTTKTPSQSEIEQVRASLGTDLQDGDPRNDPRMDAGRNVKAGYIRGHGLEKGRLQPVIASDPDWQAGWAVAQGRSIVWPPRLMNIFLIMKYSSIWDGNIIEFGSYRGGSALMMAMIAKRLRPGCKVFALDTFEGMPETDHVLDLHRPGDFAGVNLSELEDIKAKYGLDNLFFLKGLFHNTVEQIPPDERRFFLAHVDYDIYESVAFSTEYAKLNAVPGSYIIFDDPLTSSCLGAMKAVEKSLIQEGCHAEQVYPHLVFRYPPIS